MSCLHDVIAGERSRDLGNRSRLPHPFEDDVEVLVEHRQIVDAYPLKSAQAGSKVSLTLLPCARFCAR